MVYELVDKGHLPDTDKIAKAWKESSKKSADKKSATKSADILPVSMRPYFLCHNISFMFFEWSLVMILRIVLGQGYRSEKINLSSAWDQNDGITCSPSYGKTDYKFKIRIWTLARKKVDTLLLTEVRAKQADSNWCPVLAHLTIRNVCKQFSLTDNLSRKSLKNTEKILNSRSMDVVNLRDIQYP